MCATHPPFTRWISSHTRHSMSLHDRAQTQKMHKIQIWLSLNVNCIDFNFDVRTLTVQKSWWWGNRSCSWHNTHTHIYFQTQNGWMPFTRNLFVFLSLFSVVFTHAAHHRNMWSKQTLCAKSFGIVALIAPPNAFSNKRKCLLLSVMHLACYGFVTPFLSPNSPSPSCRRILFAHQQLFPFFLCVPQHNRPNLSAKN